MFYVSTSPIKHVSKNLRFRLSLTSNLCYQMLYWYLPPWKNVPSMFFLQKNEIATFIGPRVDW